MGSFFFPTSNLYVFRFWPVESKHDFFPLATSVSLALAHSILPMRYFVAVGILTRGGKNSKERSSFIIFQPRSCSSIIFIMSSSSASPAPKPASSSMRSSMSKSSPKSPIASGGRSRGATVAGGRACRAATEIRERLRDLWFLNFRREGGPLSNRPIVGKKRFFSEGQTQISSCHSSPRAGRVSIRRIEAPKRLI